MGKFQKQLKEFLKEQVEYFVSCQKEYGHGTFTDEHLDRVTTKFFAEAQQEFPQITNYKKENYWDLHLRRVAWFLKWFGDSE